MGGGLDGSEPEPERWRCDADDVSRFDQHGEMNPVDYKDELRIATTMLAERGMNVSIYNHHLCTIPTEIWPFAQRSISDWKNIFIDECEGCSLKPACAGFFHSAAKRHSSHIGPPEVPEQIIQVSSQGSATDRAVVRLHERVHQFLVPKVYVLRSYRVGNRAGSYVRSSLWRYIEEALAETIAQVGVQGLHQAFRGLRFPVANGYMYLTRTGGYNPLFGGRGLLREAGALLYTGTVSGVVFELRFENGAPPAASALR
jgi:hypothetical protein